MKYIKLEWPEIQDYMNYPNYQEECFYDACRNVWFVPEEWESNELDISGIENFGGDIGDLEDAMG